jgi:hypothetical protein
MAATAPPTPPRAPRSAMRRPQHDGQKSRPLQEKATGISRGQSPQRKRAKPRASTPQFRNSRNSRSTKRGTPCPPPRSSTSARKVSGCLRTPRCRTVCSGWRRTYVPPARPYPTPGAEGCVGYTGPVARSPGHRPAGFTTKLSTHKTPLAGGTRHRCLAALAGPCRPHLHDDVLLNRKCHLIDTTSKYSDIMALVYSVVTIVQTSTVPHASSGGAWVGSVRIAVAGESRSESFRSSEQRTVAMGWRRFFHRIGLRD